MPPAVTDAGPVPATTDLRDVVAGLRAEIQALRHAISFTLPALWRVHDDPCQPAQRVLLGEAIADLRAALENGSQ
jgi:hypothetical protein